MRGAVARILIGDGPEVAGTGFLIAPGVLVTCAHVINMALARDEKESTQPTQLAPITFQLPHSDEDEGDFTAWVFRWLPLEINRKVGKKKLPGDIALLAIDGAVGAQPLMLAADQLKKGAELIADGFPVDHPEGRTSEFKFTGTDSKDWPICAATGLLRTAAGHSGSPVFDTSDLVVGMVVAIQTESTGIGFVMPSPQLRAAWPAWISVQPTAATKPTSQRLVKEEETIVIPQAQLAQAFANLLGEDPNSVFIKPNIPPKLVNTARFRFAPGAGSISEEIVVLIDNSTGKTSTGAYGIAFTERAVYWRNPGEKGGYSLTWRQLARLRREIGIEDIDGHSLTFGRVLDIENNEIWAEDVIKSLQPLLDTAG